MVQYKWVALSNTTIGTMLQALGPAVTSALPQNVLSVLTGQTFFPNAIETPFMGALGQTFLFAAVLCFLAAACSAMSGKKLVNK
jgi:hypothetical protein